MSAVVCMADASAVHVYSLMSRLNDQRREGGAFCDILLRVGARTLPSHSCVLSACSPFFQELIRSHRPMGPHLSDHPQEIELELPSDDDDNNDVHSESSDAEADAGAVADLLDYMYTGKIELKEDSLHVVVQLAQAFALHDLTTLIGTYVNGPGANGQPMDFDSAPTALLDSLERRRRRRKKLRRQRKVEQTSSLPCVELATSAVSETLDALRILREENPSMAEGATEIPSIIVEHNLDDPDFEMEDEDSEDADEDDDDDGAEGEQERRPRCSLRPLVKRRKNNRLSDEPYECRHCPFASSELKAIREHKLLHPGRSYKCTACDYHTGLASKLLGHMETAEHPQHECSLCGSALLSEGGGPEGLEDVGAVLHRHLERHSADPRNPFFCVVCDFRCRTRGNLKMHVESKHSAERPFVCHFCGKGFKWSASLQIHLQTHQGKGFLCDQCGFRTAYKHHLKMHKRLHNGGMFICHEEGCGFQSICKQKLERHMTTAHFSSTTAPGIGRRTQRAPRAPRPLPNQQPAFSHNHAPELLPPNYVATYY